MCCLRNFFFEDNAEKNVCPTLVTLLEPPVHWILSQDIFHVKRPKLSENEQ